MQRQVALVGGEDAEDTGADDGTDREHHEVARAEQRLRIEALESKALEDFGVEPETLLGEYGPEVLVPPSPAASARK